ncbi:hypothetical protein BS78_K210000 [Paspalum vaginatum]|uniref:Uncharacterized protein n=1 Tax=Paspalum vaginatum TaxID=158149 RepID=A0A9W7X5T8_9POAL|nr:hypothetical protein BS78_K210000 [Paspalum vaginatum]
MRGAARLQPASPLRVPAAPPRRPLVRTTRRDRGDGRIRSAPLRTCSRNSTVLYVGNISPNTRAHHLWDAFSLHGRLKLARAYLPGRNYGFVEFANPQDANAVRNDLDGQEMFGRRIIVKFESEHEMYQYNNHYSHDDRYNHGQQSRETKLSVYNISPHIRERDFEDLFGRYGRGRKADLKGNSGFVEYYDPRDAHEAKRKLDMQNIDGRHISIEFKTVEQHCKNCGKNGHVPADCEATYWKGRCYCCGEKGHLKRNCRNRPKDLRQRRSYSRSPSPRYSRGQSRHYRRSRSRSYSGSPSSKRSNRNTRGE